MHDKHTDDTPVPAAHKHYQVVEHNGRRLEVPVRRVHLGGGEAPLDLYDTTGPEPVAASDGEGRCATTLEPLRSPWIADRKPGPGRERCRAQLMLSKQGPVGDGVKFRSR